MKNKNKNILTRFPLTPLKAEELPGSVKSMDRGFVTISLVLLTPFIFILAFGVLWSIWFINQKHQLDNLCYESVLKSQKFLVDQNEKLLGLNGQAKSLILKKKALDILILTGTPTVRAVAFLKRKGVLVMQKSLRLKQKSLLYWGKVLSRSELFRLKTKMNKRFKRIMGIWQPGSIPRVLVFKIQWRGSQLKNAINDIAPVYKRGRDHSSNQVHETRWSVALSSMLPAWISQMIPLQKRWEGHCESHPHKGGLKWYSAMGKGKHSLKPLSSLFF